MDTLVLSMAFEPMDQIDWQRAMTLWMGGRVEVVEAYDDRVCRTSTDEYQVPAVVRFLNSLRRRRRSVRFSRDNVFLRDSGRCQYCLRRIARDAATYDHVVPRAQGGVTNWKNVVIACSPCNQRKADRTPEQSGMYPRNSPVRPRHLPDVREMQLRRRKANMPEIWLPYLGLS